MEQTFLKTFVLNYPLVLAVAPAYPSRLSSNRTAGHAEGCEGALFESLNDRTPED